MKPEENKTIKLLAANAEKELNGTIKCSKHKLFLDQMMPKAF